MDYEAQQLQEIEALQAIYQEDELELICAQYPDIALRVKLKSGQDGERNSDFQISLLIELPSNYPDVIPRLALEDVDDVLSTGRIQKAVKDEIGILLEEKKKETELKVEEEKEKAEAIERRKFEGIIVTPESFRIWKEKFDNERKALMEKKEKNGFVHGIRAR
uniref:RWD domain-containing protein n=1 Tax=Angiostrongylus cantonensis TaxID=6313 RepID=A0A158P7Y4_ANGCA